MTTHTHTNGHDKAFLMKEFHNASQAFSQATHKAGKSARRVGNLAMEDFKEYSQVLEKKASKLVKDKPLVVLGGAVLAGAFLALLFKR